MGFSCRYFEGDILIEGDILTILPRLRCLPRLAHWSRQVLVSAVALVLAGLCDMVDGYVARKLNACSTFGGTHIDVNMR